MEKPRCLLLFEESCKTDATRRTYTQLLGYFLKWANKDHESLLVMPDNQLQMLLEDYMLYCKRRYKKQGIQGRFAAIEKFLFVNDRVVNKKKLMMFLPEEGKNHQRAITNQECLDLIKNSSSDRVRAIIHLFAATGCRPEALSHIRLRDIGQMPDDCIWIVLYADTKNELVTFAHSEATKAVNQYLKSRKENGESLKPDNFLIRKKSFIINENVPKPVTVNSLESTINHAMIQAGIKRNKIDENRYDLAVCGGFRKRFNTIFKMNPNISYSISEMFMDHKVRLEPNYTKPTKEQLFAEYKKAIPELMIDDSERKQIEITKIKQENELLESKNKELQAALKKVDELWADKQRMEYGSGKV